MFEFDPERAHKAIRKAKIQVYTMTGYLSRVKTFYFLFNQAGKLNLIPNVYDPNVDLYFIASLYGYVCI